MIHSHGQVIALLVGLLLAPQGPGGKDTDALLERACSKALQAWKDKDYRTGIAWLESLRSRLDRKPGALALLGDLHYAQGLEEWKTGRYRKAKREFERAAAIRPGEKKHWYALGRACEALEDAAGAERNYRRTVTIDPKHFDALMALARHEFSRHRYVQTRSWLDRAARLHPRDPGLILLSAKCSQDRTLTTDFKGFASPNFVIRFGGDIAKTEQDSRKILAWLETCHRELEKILGRAPDERIEVILYSSKEFGSLRGVRDWMGAFYDGKVRIPLKSWRKDRDKVRELMRHELAHAFVEEMLPGASPWLHEGFAQWYEGRTSRGSQGLFRKSPLRTAKELRSAFGQVQDASTAAVLYLQSLILVEELLSQGGTRALRRVLDQTARAKGDYAEREDRALDHIHGNTLDRWIFSLAKDRSWAAPIR